MFPTKILCIGTCIGIPNRNFSTKVVCEKIGIPKNSFRKVVWRQYATARSDLVCLTCGHTSISTLPFNVHQDYHINPVMPLNTLARNCRNFIDNENHIFIVTQIDLDSFGKKKISNISHQNRKISWLVFYIVCSNKILMCLSCLRQLPGGEFDHFKLEN